MKLFKNHVQKTNVEDTINNLPEGEEANTSDTPQEEVVIDPKKRLKKVFIGGVVAAAAATAGKVLWDIFKGKFTHSDEEPEEEVCYGSDEEIESEDESEEDEEVTEEE